MIKSNELRVGNWLINFLGEYFQATAETIAYTEAAYKEFIPPTPVSLTPEILEKCGFRDRIITYCKDGKPYHDFEFSYVDGELYYGINADEFIKESQSPIRHLHQLQNLYFALTQQELQINL